MKHIAGLAMVVVALSVPPTAWGTSDKQLEAKVIKIEQALVDLQAARIQQGTEIANKMAMVEQVLQDQNSFKGTVDAISQQQQLLFDQLKKYIDEFESRLQKVEQRIALGTMEEIPAAEGSAVLPVDGGQPAPQGPTSLYQAALNTVRDRGYAQAVQLFRDFLKAAPAHELADRAQFWVGECYYALEEYQQAIDAYNILLMKFTNSQKTAAALLRKANAYAELGKMHEAQAAFRDLIAKAPNSTEAKQASSQLQAIVNATAERQAP